MDKENNRLNFIVSFCALIVSLFTSTLVICQNISQEESKDNLRYSLRINDNHSYIFIKQANSRHIINQLSIEFNTKYSNKSINIPIISFDKNSFDIEEFKTEAINNMIDTK